jgi:two-component system, response regulator PdtaR
MEKACIDTPTTETPRPRPRKARILVVDDEPLLRLTAALLLEEAGHDVVEASTGDEAFALIEARPGRFTHLFTDVQMPGVLNGLRLASLVSTLHPDITVVVTSGDASLDEDAQEHCSRFIPKPWTPIDVLNLVTPSAT